MPLIRPEVQKVLRAAGLQKEAQNPDSPLSEKLEAAGLGLDSTLEELSQIALHSSNEPLRLRALETVLKAHGALKDTTPAPPSFTIIIQDNLPQNPQNPLESANQVAGVPSNVNPILLPRQLLRELKDKKAD